jgi:hypothetical protein
VLEVKALVLGYGIDPAARVSLAILAQSAVTVNPLHNLPEYHKILIATFSGKSTVIEVEGIGFFCRH